MPDQAPDQAPTKLEETLPPHSLTARLEPELVDLLRQIAPQIRKASRAWRRGMSADECSILAFGFTPDRHLIFQSLLVICQTDPLAPPTWEFPERFLGFGASARLTDTLAWIDRWCDPEDLPGAHRMLALIYGRDFRHSAREHQRAKLGEPGRPRAEGNHA